MSAALTSVLTLAVTVAAAAGHSSETVRTFDGDPAGRPPPGFVFQVARESAPAQWMVQRQGTNGFLAHIGSTSARGSFALAILEGSLPATAGWVSARARLQGSEGSFGILWRVQDADNYYLARLDLSKQDIGLYRVVRGNRIRIEGEDDLELDPAAWHTLKIVQDDDDIRVYIGGIRVLRTRDRTFAGPGAAGVWCTGDADAHFDDVRIGSDKDAGSRRGR